MVLSEIKDLAIFIMMTIVSRRILKISFLLMSCKPAHKDLSKVISELQKSIWNLNMLQTNFKRTLSQLIMSSWWAVNELQINSIWGFNKIWLTPNKLPKNPESVFLMSSWKQSKSSRSGRYEVLMRSSGAQKSTFYSLVPSGLNWRHLYCFST